MTVQELSEQKLSETAGRIGRLLHRVALYVWQLPQNLLGLALLLFLSPSKVVHDYGLAVVRQSKRMSGGISLGNYIFVQEQVSMFTIWHELGHVKQSRLLGPLYLIFIGLPSILWAGIHDKLAPRKSYYWFYTERWADRLGGVER